mmetsp:Transcript_25448/g.66621  ORF Transcript_25448/g.66621 Transcript_25448/m.66621 type:complete len:80 (-) Transcript_25448:444-683(-)
MVVVVLPLTSVESVVRADPVESVVLADPVEFSEPLSQVIAHGSDKKRCMVPAVMEPWGREPLNVFKFSKHGIMSSWLKM